MKEYSSKKDASFEEYEREIFAAELGEASSVDLHGMRAVEALDVLEPFLHREIMRGTRVLKIIHGRGSGRLREKIHAWLDTQKNLVPYYRDAVDTKAQGGVTYAVLESMH